MKLKLSALTLALLPCFSQAAINVVTDTEHSSATNDSVIVVFKESATKAQRLAARQLVSAKITDVNKDEIDDGYKHVLKGRLAEFKLDKKNPKAVIKALSEHEAVQYVEPNYRLTIQGTPDDPKFSELWGLHNTGQTGGTADADIDAVEAWDISVGSRDVVVGVIDTGVDHTHPDLTANMWINPNEIAGDGIDNDNNGYIDDMHGINAITDVGDPMDDQGHGTHVSGTIGAVGNDGVGVVGVNQQVSIVGCKFLDASGSGSSANAIKCIDYLVGLRNAGVDVRVSNNSWGGGGFSQAMSDALTSSEEAGILFVAAAGNSAVDNDTNPHYPSSYEHASILSIASTTHTDAMSSFSQWGLTSVDLGAPGSAIVSTVPGGGYDSYSGTSMATPHVAGAAALALSVNPDLTTAELKELLMNSGDDNAALNGKTVSGKRLNVATALEEADPTPGFRLSATPVSQEITAGETASYTFEVASVAGWSGDISLAVTSDLAGAVLSTSTVQPGGSFTLTAPTTADTQWGSYSFTVEATSGDLRKDSQLSLYVNPQGLTEFDYSNNEKVDIPDNDPTGASSIINVSDEVTIFGSDTLVDISHTYIGDLVVTLTSPAGTTATLHNKAGGGADDINQSFASSAFNGEVAQGDWTLKVVDTYAEDTGSINQWALTLTGLGEVGPRAPEADFLPVVDSLQVSFFDGSRDANDDISTWAWDFGDGNTSSEQNPVHVYGATGLYPVTLTVTDATGLTDSRSMDVVVAGDSDTAPELKVKRANKTRLGFARIELSYQGAATSTVDVYRDGELLATTLNTGAYRDFIRRATQSQYVYKVCTSVNSVDICSEEVTVTFN
ncbi:S8 family serine peptidase [Pseudoalteromonas sp. MMG013]|uniref:S8 family serine peptidase n=1 Tax=unclassified Pseudoalteromonas TaxID=194690 RepID=UPI001B3967EC|nr:MULTISPECIES: S8 family serine peptidase [unclassified Pseudoalteromonas]MBQ4847552.1 S8 family serine peptidase [Pseudoalteromonas sp. MMG005]MBQ4864509.1 S8 family serine peptidase [Pseudoalteromonas sp. MMG013]